MKRNSKRIALVSLVVAMPLLVSNVSLSAPSKGATDATVANSSLKPDDVSSTAPTGSSPANPSIDRVPIEPRPDKQKEPVVVEPVIHAMTNDNDIHGSAVAQLCWYRREMVLSLVSTLASDTVRARIKTGAPRDVAITIRDWKGVSEVPAELRPFADRLQGDATQFAAIDKVDTSTLLTFFDMEHYPAVKDYIRVATQTPGCPEP